jgi:hypothetical protein
MPRNTILATRDWGLLTTTDVTGAFTVQMRGSGRLFVARGTDTAPPGPNDGVFFGREADGIGGITLATLDPGGAGNRLWCRFRGFGVSEVWCSWEDTPQ